MTNNQATATTIFNQMGGMNRIAAMTGAKNFGFSSTEAGNVKASFLFKGSRKVNGLEVTLENDDTYKMTFSKTTPKAGYNVIAETANVHGDQLAGIFTNITGLYLSL
tara:strand:- start:13277 stop:13597 length:321 start_codon:yes stop_codon:yes gene_type:complete